ncbi:MAG: DUF1326 domain-containing protein [Bryobacteraceae bacterium]|nr:DUF1326 domain-containing protein [Bryobacteraceae bacterium]
MKSIAIFAASAALAATAFGAGLDKSRLHGEYVEARNADNFVGPCFQNSEINLTGDLAVSGWRIASGAFEGVKLDGLAVVAVVRASATLGDIHHTSYPVKSVLIVDEKANAEQRVALQKFAKRMAGDLLQDVQKVLYMPVTLDFAGNNVHTSVATLKAGNLAEITTRAIKEGDSICTHEELVYAPLSKLDHHMAAYTVSSGYRGEGLDATWSSPEKRSAVVGTFQLND